MRQWTKLEKQTKWLADGYVLDYKGNLLHRTVCYKVNGPFPRDWVVHHIDERKKNNAPENLIAMPRKLHDKLHGLIRKTRLSFNRAKCQAMVDAWVGMKASGAKGKLEISITVTTEELEAANEKKKGIAAWEKLLESPPATGSSSYR